MSAFYLKIIAVAAMLVDHIGMIFFDNLFIFRAVGRISFPIFAFLIFNGFKHTSDIKKYLLRLFVLALLSELPFDLALYGSALHFNSQNVFFTLFLGLLSLHLYERFPCNIPYQPFLCALIAFLTRSDYSFLGVLLIFSFRYLKTDKKNTVSLLALLTAFTLAQILLNAPSLIGTKNIYTLFSYILLQLFTLLSAPLISSYNLSRGASCKYFFYLFYPLHLLILFFISSLFF